MDVRVCVSVVVEVGMIRAVGMRVPVFATVGVHVHPFYSTSIGHGCHGTVQRPCWMVDNTCL